MTDYNLKERLVVCPKCKHEMRTAECEPVCNVCKTLMITVLFSLMTGERITK